MEVVLVFSLASIGLFSLFGLLQIITVTSDLIDDWQDSKIHE